MYDGPNMRISEKKKTCPSNIWVGMLRGVAWKMVHYMSIPCIMEISVDGSLEYNTSRLFWGD